MQSCLRFWKAVNLHQLNRYLSLEWNVEDDCLALWHQKQLFITFCKVSKVNTAICVAHRCETASNVLLLLVSLR